MIILASNSPTRKKLLEEYNISFKQVAFDFDEDSIKTTNPKSFAYQVCKYKLDIALKDLKGNLPILVADSVVSVNSTLQRKAKNKEEARAMLLNQSNQEIAIITAQILKSQELEICDISQTLLKLNAFDHGHLQEYLDSNLWQGKAGSVMVEGFHSKYIIKQEGLFSTALGLSIEKFLPFFEII